MDEEDLKHLRDLSNRATDNHVLGYGSANVVIFKAEFHALEEAINELEQKRKAPTWKGRTK